MNAATTPRDPRSGRLLILSDTGPQDRRIADLPAALCPGDLLVLNDAATLPASLRTTDGMELRLLSWQGGSRWQAVRFGPGDWRQDTDLRPAPPLLAVGESLELIGGLSASVLALSPLSPRLVTVEFSASDASMWAGIYAAGRPVQYAYMDGEVPLSAVQNVYAGRPWAVEMPSAGRALTWGVLDRLAARGVTVARLTHAAGLSATGDAALDAALPLPERYEIPAQTVAAIAATRAAGGRIIAAGTSTVRALEGNHRDRGGRPGAGITDLRIGPDTVPAVVDGLLTNMHEPGESHFELLTAFAPRPALIAAAQHAAAAGYLAHEFGDIMLVHRGAGRCQ